MKGLVQVRRRMYFVSPKKAKEMAAAYDVKIKKKMKAASGLLKIAAKVKAAEAKAKKAMKAKKSWEARIYKREFATL